VALHYKYQRGVSLVKVFNIIVLDMFKCDPYVNIIVSIVAGEYRRRGSSKIALGPVNEQSNNTTTTSLEQSEALL
jgi:hypothetical protein